MLQKYALFLNKTAYLKMFFLFYAEIIIFIILNNIFHREFVYESSILINPLMFWL